MPDQLLPGPDWSAFKGVITPGNIDLANRPILRNRDGSISTVNSMSFEADGKHILVPLVSAQGMMDPDTAIQRYRRTGEHLGIFDSPDAATTYAKALHEAQDGFYRSRH